MNYEMSERDSDWHGPMSDPNTGGTLEQIQKERREAFLTGFKCINYQCDNAGNIPHQISEGEWEAQQCQFCFEIRFPAADFLSESIRIAYEAGQENTPLKNRAIARETGYKKGFRAGLERAKALVPNNYVALSLLADIDEEIAKNTTSQLSERDADWGGLPDENSRTTSEEI